MTGSPKTPQERIEASRIRRAARRKRRNQRRLDARLEVFLELSDALMATPFLQQVDSFSRLTISFDRSKGTSWTSEGPSQDQLTLLLARTRPVFLNDWTNLENVYDLLLESVRSDELRGHLLEAQDMWRRQQKSNGFALNVNGRDITPAYAARIFMYGGREPAHYNLDDRAALAAMGLPGQILTKTVYLGYLQDAIEHIAYIARITREVQRFGLADAT